MAVPNNIDWNDCSWPWDEAFIQYSNELWPNDPNFMIRLLLCLFHNLKKRASKGVTGFV